MLDHSDKTGEKAYILHVIETCEGIKVREKTGDQSTNPHETLMLKMYLLIAFYIFLLIHTKL